MSEVNGLGAAETTYDNLREPMRLLSTFLSSSMQQETYYCSFCYIYSSVCQNLFGRLWFYHIQTEKTENKIKRNLILF